MNKYLIIIVCMMFVYSCSEENNRVPLASDSTIPGLVSNVRTERLPGAIKFTYDTPGGQSLSYVKAECMINGVLRQAKASSYVNTLIMEGFADTSLYTISLYSVNRSEMASKPVEVIEKPLMPSFLDVFKKHLRLEEDWGGVATFYENPNESDISINMIYKGTDGYWKHGNTFYTKQKSGYFSLRGFEPKQNEFGVYIRDRWNNSTDTMFRTLTPRFEKEIDRSKFAKYELPTDVPKNTNSIVSYEAMWDGNMAKLSSTGTTTTCYISAGTVFPQWITINLNLSQGAYLSRFKFWQRCPLNSTYCYQERNIRKFELWGSMNPAKDGSWDSWTYMLTGELVRPSGFASTPADEDYQAALDGHEFVFPVGMPRVNFIRLKVLQAWDGTTFQLAQIALWGQEPSDNPPK